MSDDVRDDREASTGFSVNGGNILGASGYDSDVKGEEAGHPGDWAGFEAEALPHAAGLFRLAMWLERNRHEAEDLVQETLTRALQSFHRFTPGTNCRAWLITILHYVRSNRLRALRRHPLVEDADDRIAETVPFVPAIPQRLTDEEMLEALGSLPEAYQHVILLCDVEEMTYREIAEALQIPVGTVMSRLHRGRALLRLRLAALQVPAGAAVPAARRRAREG